MDYLFGDSTPSSLKSNFLEFLRDALDFSVFVVQADARIQEGRVQMRELRREAEAETGRLNAFVKAIQRAIEEAPKGALDSPTARCASQLATLGADALASSIRALEDKLAADIAEAEAREKAERAACGAALEALLVPHEPPDASIVRSIELESEGTYRANLVGEVGGVGYHFDLTTGDLWSGALRVERIIPELEITAPQVSGWISKEVKARPQRLERHVLTKLVDDGDTVTIELRAEPGAAVGFDVEADLTNGRVKMARVGPKENAATGPFEVTADDAPKLSALAEKLRADAADFKRHRLVAASFDGQAFEAEPTLRPFVERIVSLMAPIVHEIAERSLTPNELVLRRMLSNDRREEIFVAKSTLREKYAPLTEEQRALFAPLGLKAATPSKRPSAAPRAEAPPTRSELPPSKPPPPLPAPPAPAPAAEPAPPIGGKNAAIVAALKTIAGFAKEGNFDEAYRQYAELFRSRAFTDAGADEQRQVIRLMVRVKPPTAKPVVQDAYRALVACLKVLIEKQDDPADYEMLGIAHLALDDQEAARQVFGAALARERVRNPGSELCANLTKRMSGA